MRCGALNGGRLTSGIDGAGVVFIEDVEDVLDFEDVGLVEAGALVGARVELGLGRLREGLLVGSAHATIKYYERSILFDRDKI